MLVFKGMFVFDTLFESFYIGRVEVPNRLVMSSMVVGYAGIRGEVTDQLIAYYEARARGGVGLIITEAAYVSTDGRLASHELGIYDDDLIPGLSRLVDVVRSYGVRISAQLVHGGIQAKVQQPVGPSAIGRKYFPPPKTPRELSTEEVEGLVEVFARAALRAKQAGFDFVEVHGTHGYLIMQFLSPLTNRRTDKYGLDRVLFVTEVVQRIKERCGRDYPVGIRLGCDEFIEGGITIDYAKYVAKRLVDAGVNYINVTGGNFDSRDMISPPYYHSLSEGWFFRLAKEIKSVVDVPVISGGLISDPNIAEKAVKEGIVDAVFLGRQLIADPEWPKKVREGRLEDIRPCLACNDGCIGRIITSKPVWCSVNPLTGFEYRWSSEEELPKVRKRKNVVVIGGGPAGLEVARILAIRGHNVTLVDSNDSLGGTLRIASIPEFKYRVRKLIKWYEGQLKKLNVNVVLRTKVTPELIRRLSPDVVVIATGSKPLIPNIPGTEYCVIADDVLLGRVGVGQKVIVVGGGLVGVEVALHLAINGKDVTVVEVLPEVARDLEPISRLTLLKPNGLLSKYNVKVLTSTYVVKVEKEGVEVLKPPLERSFIKADTVVLAVGRTSELDREILSTAKEVAKEVYVIGDAKNPRKVIDAVHEAFFTALNI